MGRGKKSRGTTWTPGNIADLIGAVCPAIPVAVDDLDAAELLQAVKSRREELGPVLNTAFRAFLNGTPRESAAQAAPTIPTPDAVTFEVTNQDHDGLPEGWELAEDESVRELNDLVILEEYGFHREGETYVGGEVMLARAKEQGRLGLRAARALERQQHLIPAQWRGKKVLVFAGTVAFGQDRRRRVVYLSWSGGRWRLDWTCLSASGAAGAGSSGPACLPARQARSLGLRCSEPFGTSGHLDPLTAEPPSRDGGSLCLTRF